MDIRWDFFFLKDSLKKADLAREGSHINTKSKKRSAKKVVFEADKTLRSKEELPKAAYF